MEEQADIGRNNLERATFGAGCFWGIEAVFRRISGVVTTSVGFMGGRVKKPSYMQVCGGDTGHTEVVAIVYNPALVSYSRLLEIFFDNHDPTTPDRQGADIGRQYRSVIFYHSEEQKNAALARIAELTRSGKYRSKIVTSVEPASEFYRAEEYHQQYYEKCGNCYTVHR